MDGLDGCVRTRNNHLGNRPAVGGRKDAIGLGGGGLIVLRAGARRV
jgi:hypothetical protein